VEELLFDAFPILKTAPPRTKELRVTQGIRKTLAHKQVLVRDGKECAFLPFVLKVTLRVYKTSETGKELTLYRIERGESCILTATRSTRSGGDSCSASIPSGSKSCSPLWKRWHSITWIRGSRRPAACRSR